MSLVSAIASTKGDLKIFKIIEKFELLFFWKQLSDGST